MALAAIINGVVDRRNAGRLPTVAAVLKPLARGSAGCYFELMLRLSQFGHLLLALALVIGLVTHAARAAGMDSNMGMAASTMQTCDGDDCGTDGSQPCKSAGVCSLLCNGMIALPATTAVLDVPPAAAAPICAVQACPGWSAPPDPYPPRRSVLS